MAVDFGGVTTRVVQGERVAGRLSISRAVEFAIDAAATTQSLRDDSSDVVDVLAAATSDAPAPLDLTPHGFSANDAAQGCILALARESVLMGMVELPADDEAEVRSMARIALARDYAPESVEARGVETLGDFQLVRKGAGRTTVIVAAAVSARVQAAVTRVSLPVARVGIRALGALALIRTHPTHRNGTTLFIDACADGVEFVVISNGELLHARGASLATGEATTRATAIHVQLRRLLAALRTSMTSLVLDRVVIATDDSTGQLLQAQVATSCGCAVSMLHAHPLVDFPDVAARDAVRAACWPLVGLLLEDEAALSANGGAIDLLHPTPLIDVAARMRQRVLIVAGALLIAALGGWTFGRQSWHALEERRDDLELKARNALPELRRTKRDQLMLGHVEAYRAMSPTWLDHLEALRRFAPDPSSVVLDGLSAQLSNTDIEYSSSGKFIAAPELKFILDGEAKDRTVADGLRDALVKEKSYTLGSTGADARGGRRLQYPFAYTVRTADLAPRPAVVTAPSDANPSPPDTNAPSGGSS